MSERENLVKQIHKLEDELMSSQSINQTLETKLNEMSVTLQGEKEKALSREAELQSEIQRINECAQREKI